MGVDQTLSGIRGKAADLIRRRRDALTRAWRGEIADRLGATPGRTAVPRELLEEDTDAYVTLVADGLEGCLTSGASEGLRHWLTDAQQYRISIEDVVEALLFFEETVEEVVLDEPGLTADERHAMGRAIASVVGGHVRCAVQVYRENQDKLSGEITQRSQEIFTVWKLANALTAVENLDTVFNLALPVLRRTLGHEQCRFLLFDEDGTVCNTFTDQFNAAAPIVRGSEPGQEMEVFAWCAKRQEIFVCRDVTTDDRLVNGEQLRSQGVRSFVCNPFSSRKTVVGAVLLGHHEPRDLSVGQTRFLQEISAVIAHAFDHVLDAERSYRRKAELEVIGLIGRSLLEVRSPSETMTAVATALQQYKGFFDVCLFRVDEERGECRLVAQAGTHLSRLPADYRQSIGRGLVGWCARTGKTILANDAAADERRILAFEGEEQARSELSIPIQYQERVIGVMHFESRQLNAFDVRDVNALEAIATYIGAAMQNADLTAERERAQYEIAEAYRHLDMLMKTSGAGITAVDTKGVYTHWSDSCAAIFGYARDEVVGKLSLGDLAAEPLDLNALLKECRERGLVRLQRRIRCKDGSVRWVEETRLPHADQAGTHVGYIAYVTDITDRKLSELRLRQEWDKMTLVVDAIGAGLALADADLRLRWINKTLADWFGVSPAVDVKPAAEIFRSPAGAFNLEPMRTALSTGQAAKSVERCAVVGGTPRYLQFSYTPIEHGEHRLLILVTDVTEQVHRMEQLQLPLSLSNAIKTAMDFDRLLYTILTCMTFGEALGFNRAAMFLVDEEQRTLAGRMAVGPSSWEEANRIWWELGQIKADLNYLLEKGEPQYDSPLSKAIRAVSVPLEDEQNLLISVLRGRQPVVLSDGDPALSRMPTALRDQLGFRRAVLLPLVVRDKELGVIVADNAFSGYPITDEHVRLVNMFGAQAGPALANAIHVQKLSKSLDDLRKAQQEILHRERLATVGRMAAQVMHDLKKPLIKIGMVGRMVARRHKDDNTTFNNGLFISEQAKSLEDSLNEILNFSRPSANLSLVDGDLNEMVRDTMNLFKQDLLDHEVSCRLRLQEDLPKAKLDERKIKEVVMNLVENAMQSFNGPGGRLEIHTWAEGGYVNLSVSDTGAGMDERTQQRLFEPFFTTKVTGTGLGLALSKKYLEEHDGQIQVTSQLGAGSTFSFRIPIGGPNTNHANV